MIRYKYSSGYGGSTNGISEAIMPASGCVKRSTSPTTRKAERCFLFRAQIVFRYLKYVIGALSMSPLTYFSVFTLPSRTDIIAFEPSSTDINHGPLPSTYPARLLKRKPTHQSNIGPGP